MSKLKELVELIGTLEYREDIPEAALEFARQNRLVICYGHSDDLVELDGAFREEYDSYEVGDIYLWPEMKVPDLPCDCDDSERCPLFQKIKPTKKIEALWCATDEASWTFKADVPTETFTIMEDGEVFCVGIVFEIDAIGC